MISCSFHRFAAVTLIAAFASLAQGASSRAEAEAVLTFSWPQNAGPLNPHHYGANQMYAQAMVYEGLVRYEAGGEVVPWLATGWTTSADGRVWTFTLRDGVTFSNGVPFDADAVAANFNALIGQSEQHEWLALIAQLVSVKAVGPLEVQFTLREAYYPLLQELALVRPVRILEPGQLAAKDAASDAIAAPIGTGPWRLAETVQGEFDVFLRNETYWGPAPGYDKVVVKVITDPNSRAIAFETGEIDLIYGAEGPIPPDTFARFQAMGQWQTALSGPMETRAIALNSNRGPTADLAVRQAINHAVNKDLMIATVLGGMQLRADTLFPPGIPYADIGLTPYAYDPARAETLLEADGWIRPEPGAIREKDAKPLQIDLVFYGADALMKAMAEVIQADLRKTGIGVTLIGAEQGSVTARQIDGDFGMIFNDTWGAPYDPHAFVGAMRAPAHADYQAQLGMTDKPGLDRQISEVLISTDEEARRALYRSILTSLHEEAIYLPLTNARALLVAQPGIGNTGFGPVTYEIPFERFTPPPVN